MYVHDGYAYFCFAMKYLVFVFSVCFSTLLSAQKFDHVWLVGHDRNFDDNLFVKTMIDFNSGSPIADSVLGYVNMNMFISNASISDSSGNLLFYSNGCDIADKNNEILPNGQDINPGPYHYTLCDDIGRGYSAGYPSMVILPLPETDSLYYLFHKSIKYVSLPVEDGFVDKLMFSVIGTENNELAVLEKNILVMGDSLAYGEMNAVKHANGKDWWIITARRNSNQFYIFLFTKDGIVDTLTQTIGDLPPAIQEGYGQTAFSPDGTRMIRYYPYTPIMNYTFDRNTGYFTNYSTFLVNYGNDFAHQGGCAISPSGQFLYITALLQVYQFDLWAADIGASQIKVAIWDGFKDPIAISFWLCQQGPDCKIYIIGGGDTRYYHIIHNPDEPGLACNFEQRGLVLPTPSGASIPYFPNYRLGPIDNPGVPCTATVSVSPPLVQPLKNAVHLWPNPATERITIGFAFTDASVTHQVLLTNAVGQLVGDFQLSGSEGEMNVSIAHLPTGIYYYTVSGSYAPGTAGKLFINR
jgi:hypothetical protein